MGELVPLLTVIGAGVAWKGFSPGGVGATSLRRHLNALMVYLLVPALVFRVMVQAPQDRGVIRVGSPAGILVYDFDKRSWTDLEKAYDLPAGDWRLVTTGIGYRYTLVNGVVTAIDGSFTGATPGLLLRHGSESIKSTMPELRDAA